jgi:ribonuclease HI
MSTESSVYLGFIDGASHHTKNLASIAWVVYSPKGQLVSSGGIFLGPSMNNVVEYSVVIDILRDANFTWYSLFRSFLGFPVSSMSVE